MLQAAAVLPAAMAAPALLLAPRAARAEGMEVLRAGIEPAIDGEGWLLAADVAMQMSPRLEEAVSRGIPLYFVADFSLWRGRWWWFDDRVAEASQTWRLSYHALTRSWRVTVNGYTSRHASLQEAVDTITRIRGWRVLERGSVRSGTPYEGTLRLRLDVSQLPKPFQLTALNERDWNLQTEWKRFPFNPETARSVPSAER